MNINYICQLAICGLLKINLKESKSVNLVMTDDRFFTATQRRSEAKWAERPPAEMKGSRRLKPFRYAHVKIRTQAVVISGRMRYQLHHGFWALNCKQ